MRRIMFPVLLCSCCAVVLTLAGPAHAPARAANWVSFPALSPDARTLYFTAWGDIFSAPVDGSAPATRLTDNVAYDGRPTVSPDGKQLAFLSDRFGNYDIFTMPVTGGDPTRLTYDSGVDYIYDWKPDGSAVLEYGEHQDLWGNCLYEVPLSGEQPRRITGPDHYDNVFGKYLGDSQHFVFARGSSDWARKSHHGSDTYDLWEFDEGSAAVPGRNDGAQGRAPSERQLTNYDGKDAWPQPTPDGKTVYFVSDRDGTENIWALSIAPAHASARGSAPLERQSRSGGAGTMYPGATASREGGELRQTTEPEGVPPEGEVEEHQVTHFSGDGPRWPRISGDGNWLTFTVGGEPYVLQVGTPLAASAGATSSAPATSEPRKVDISFSGDPKQELQLSSEVHGQLSEFALSPNGKYYAFVNTGDVYLLKNPDTYKPDEKPDQDLSRAFRLTNTPGREWQLSWSPKSTQLAYISDRDGQYDVYTYDLAKKEEKRITSSTQDEWLPKFAPQGNLLAYYSGNRSLRVYDLDKGTERELANGHLRAGPFSLGYEWSWDGKWIAYTLTTKTEGADVFIVGLADGKSVDVSRTPDWNEGAVWSRDGKYLAWTHETDAGAEVMLLELSPKERKFDTDLLFPEDQPKKDSSAAVPSGEKDIDKCPPEDKDKKPADGKKGAKGKDGPAVPGAEEKKAAEVKIEFDRIHLRAKSITQMHTIAVDPQFDPSSKFILFTSEQHGERSYWTVTIDGGNYAQLGPADGRSNPQFAPDGSRLYTLAGGNIVYSNMGGAGPAPGGGQVAEVARVDYNQYAVWDQMLLEGWRSLRDGFYDPKMNGVDWNAVLARYRPRVQELGTYDEFSQLMREMLGELGASHLGYNHAGNDANTNDVTADLGVLYDEKYEGTGWRIAEVVHDGPSDVPGSQLHAGETILSVNGAAVMPQTNRAKLLNNLAGQPLKLEVQAAETGAPAKVAVGGAQATSSASKTESGEKLTPNAGGATAPNTTRTVIVNPVPLPTIGQKRYAQWVEDNRAKVYAASDNQIAYQHIQGMDGPSLEKFRRELFSESFGKKALIIDVRFNGGGNIHEELVNILDRRPFSIAAFRDDERFTQPALRWEGPIVVLINPSSYSDAEIFPHVMQKLGLATLVGEPTGGNVIGTFDFPLLDGSTFRLPNRGWWLLDNVNMEGHGAVPDVLVKADPQALASGVDNQLDAAVKYLQEKIASEKK